MKERKYKVELINLQFIWLGLLGLFATQTYGIYFALQVTADYDLQIRWDYPDNLSIVGFSLIFFLSAIGLNKLVTKLMLDYSKRKAPEKNYRNLTLQEMIDIFFGIAIIRWGILAEITVVGFALSFLRKDGICLYSAVASSTILFVMDFPTANKIRSYFSVG